MVTRGYILTKGGFSFQKKRGSNNVKPSFIEHEYVHVYSLLYRNAVNVYT